MQSESGALANSALRIQVADATSVTADLGEVPSDYTPLSCASPLEQESLVAFEITFRALSIQEDVFYLFVFIVMKATGRDLSYDQTKVWQ